jgi:pantoate--beta-alanine ligase
MKTISSLMEMQATANQLCRAGRKIGFVPTMGYLHAGHLSLIKAAREQCDSVIVSVFVNPTQFAPNEDFAQYPRDVARDAALASEAGVDFFFIPETVEMYPDGYSTFVTVEGLSSLLEGAVRPTHFRGVTTVVLKLLELTKPHVMYLGQKDVQQCAVLRRMARDLNLDVIISICPTVRESDGLAMSSRNVYLSPEDRRDVPILHRSLRDAAERIHSGVLDCLQIRAGMEALLSSVPHASPDYIAIIDGETLQPIATIDKHRQTIIALAVRFGATRLIDNAIIDAVN